MHICAKELWAVTNLVQLQGAPATAFAISATHFEEGFPHSPVGEPTGTIAKEVEVATSDQSHSLGATDTDVPAKEGKSEEMAWELFTR